MTDVEQLARRAERSDGSKRAARAGLVARGVVWSLIGVLAASVAAGGEQDADQGGALRAVGDSPAGGVLLVVLAVAFVGLAGNKALTAAVGHRDHEGASRLLHRLGSAGKALVYLLAAAACVRTVVGQAPDGEEQADSVTARVMEVPGGRTAVGVLGALAVVVAVALVVRALKHDHADDMRPPPRWRRRVLWLGVAGHTGRSLAIALVGGFLVHAALRYDPDEAKGLDAALQAVRDQPAGPALLVVAAAALLAYGLWSFAEAAWRDV